MIEEIKKEKVVELAMKFYAEGKGRDEFVKECESLGLEATDETAQELAYIWADTLIKVENEKHGKVVKSIFTVLSETDTVTHFRNREESVVYINGLTAKVIKVLTDSGLTQGDAVNSVNAALSQVKLINDEITKTLNVHTKKAFKAVLGKESEDLTLQEIVDIIEKDVDDRKE